MSDELNHNCIINAMRLARPKDKRIYRHLDMADLEEKLAGAAGSCRRAIVVTDGIFSMRGVVAPLPRIVEIARRYDSEFPENVVVLVDDSHGVGAFGETGRGTEEATGRDRRRPRRHAGQGARGQRRLRRGLGAARRVPARDRAHLHLLEPDHRGGGGGGGGGPVDRRRTRAAATCSTTCAP